MNPKSAKKTLLLSLLISGAVVTLADIRRGGMPPARKYISLGTVFLLSGLLLEIAPAIGAGMAILVSVSMLLRHGESAIDALIGAKEYSPSGSRPSVVPGATGISGNMPAAANVGGAWNGSKNAVQNVTRAGKAKGVRVSSAKRARRTTVSGSVSDHATACRACYAEDLVGTVRQMDNAAVAIARELGISSYRKGQKLEVTINRNGFRIQALYRTMTGGNHFDHIHIGARLLTYNPETEWRKT